MQIGMCRGPLKLGEWLSKTAIATCYPGTRMHFMGSPITMHR